MGYLQEFEQELHTRVGEIKTDLCHDPHEVADWEQWAADLTKFVKEKILESYRNGQRDCSKCNPKPPRSREKK